MAETFHSALQAICDNLADSKKLGEMFVKNRIFYVSLTLWLPLLLAGGYQDGAGNRTAAARTPVVVELFTSEGCSSCPPADDLLAQFVRSQPIQEAQIIALAQHVDYWDRMGWKDPYSSPQFTERQKVYADFFRNDGAYTPQMVVDGQAEFIGSNSGKAREAVSKAARAPKARVSLSPAGTQAAANGKSGGVPLKVKVEDLPASHDAAEVLLAVTEDNLHSDVQGGENAGSKLSHTAVVRRLTILGKINSKQPLFSGEPIVALDGGWKIENLRAVVLVQEKKSRRILGAASIPLKSE